VKVFPAKFILGLIIFGSVRFLLKKIIKLKFFLKNTETSSNRPVSVQFDFLGQKPDWLSFSGFARFFRFGLVLARFFVFGFGLVSGL